MKYTYEETSTEGSYKIISLKYSKNLVFGVKSSSSSGVIFKYGNFTDEFSEHADISIYLSIYYYVIYESPEFPLSYNELKLTYKNNRYGNRVCLSFIYILDEMIPTLNSVGVSVSMNSISKSGSYECSAETCLDKQYTETPCGIRCKSKSAIASFSYTFTGVRFQVFGTNNPSHTSFNIYVDDLLAETASQTASKNEMYVLQYTSDILTYGQHTIRAECENGQTFEISKFVYGPSLQAKRINITGFSHTDTIHFGFESDGSGGLAQYSSNGEVRFTYETQCSKLLIMLILRLAISKTVFLKKIYVGE